jgi:serine/threonine protein kinase
VEPPQADQPTGDVRAGRATAPLQPVRSPSAFPAGTRVGKYEIIRVLGRGGMGQVYLARDVVLGRRVAIKFMLDVRASFVERFHAEARATARCQHENIVVIHEIGDYHGHGFMVLEHLEGETLHRTIEGGPHAAPRAIELMVPVARALVHAHAHGLVHRDLKPENVFVTIDGSVKVLDFGIARAFDAPLAEKGDAERSPWLTAAGAVIGTPMYMAPEQHRGETVDHRADLWSFGLILHELVTRQHPLGAEPNAAMIASVADLDLPFPSAREVDATLPPDVVRVIDRCLQKAPDQRFASAAALLEALEGLGHARAARRAADASPYPGLAAFSDDDADVYFGRTSDVRRGLQRLRESPLLGVVGPSGVGKSSFVRAGLGSALSETEGWEIMTSRPGRDPLRSLVELAAEVADGDLDQTALLERLRAEPGYLAELLRGWVRRTKRQALIFVDQFEELYTLVPAIEDRAAYVACLVAIADDVAAPLRVVVAMRSDFLDRIAESPDLMAHLSRNLMFLSPLDRAGLRESLAHPAKLAGYTFESDDVVEDILDALEHTSGALPLLQFVASLMWDARDTAQKTLTAAAYRDMGGVVGAIAAHADQIVADLTPAGQREVRALFQRMVTPERTRAIVEMAELVAASKDVGATEALIDTLVRARLLLVSGHGDERTVEIVHDSLITGWPRLAVWIEEEHEVVAFAQELRAAARQWDERGRPVGLVWRGDVLYDARRMRARLEERGALTQRERSFLDAAIALDERALRVRRRLLLGSIALLALIAAGATVALLWVRSAEREARFHAEQAAQRAQQALDAQLAARKGEERAKAAEDARGVELDRRKAAEREAETASSTVVQRDQDLAAANKALTAAVEVQKREAERASAAQVAAEREAQRAQRAEEEVRAKQKALEQLLSERDEELARLNERLKKISVDLK